MITVKDHWFKCQLNFLIAFFLLVSAGLIALTTSAGAQGDDPQEDSLDSVFLEEIVVTARKREELIQEVPLSISYFSSEKIEDLKVRDLTSLSVNMPNVALDDVGTIQGIANFSIRGLSISSSIPSIDPTTGVFIDGIYMGLNPSVLFDTFDLESIEVLRGPQGTLFGKNVTGGAILLNTKKPGDQFEFSFRTSIEGGGESPNAYLTTSVGGPVSDSIGFRLSFYTNQDEGWFKNAYTGDDFGEADTVMFRPVLSWQPTDNISLVLRYEYQDINTDGPAGQSLKNGRDNPTTLLGLLNPALAPDRLPYFDQDSHDFSIDEEGFRTNKNHFFSARADWDIDFGEGTITNIFGWFDSKGSALIDLDASPSDIIKVNAAYEARQFSNELRYTGTFYDRLQLTSGFYYYNSSTDYNERRLVLGDFLTFLSSPTGQGLLTTLPSLAQMGVIPPGAAELFGGLNQLVQNGARNLTQNGGGNHDVESLAFFMSLDYKITSRLTLIAGMRYTNEEKKARINYLEADLSSIIQESLVPVPCDIVEGPDCEVDFQDRESWNDLSPKVGLSLRLRDDVNLYGHWTRGFRSGGYNLRHVGPSPGIEPGPYDQERIDSFETGFKFFGQRARFSSAFFYNLIKDFQQEVPKTDPIAAVVQIIENTADAEIFGFELDGSFALTRGFFLLASLGYINAEYTDAKFDLNDDGAIDGRDEDLELPRAAKWTYSVGMLHNFKIGSHGGVASRINYAYRDDSFLTHDNRGILREQNIIDAAIQFYSNGGQWSISLYGKNLLNEVKHGGHSFLPQGLGTVGELGSVERLGGTFSPLAKGRIYGLELAYKFSK